MKSQPYTIIPTEKFNKEWASLIETVKYRFGQVFDCDITHIPHNSPQ